MQGELLDGLSTRQREVIDLIVKGYTRNEIATALAISAHTAHQHERAIFKKLGCHRRGRVAALLAEHAALAHKVIAACLLGGLTLAQQI